MRKPIYIVLSFTLIVAFLSCKKENAEVSTVIKGHVADTISKMNISGYKVIVLKCSPGCANWMCGISTKEVATAYTDDNGNYSITLNYNLNPGEYYGMQKEYGTPYYTEYNYVSGAIIAGKTNAVDMYVWKPVELRLNVDVLNNNHTPLVIGNELVSTDDMLFGTENVYEQNIKKTYSLRSKPNSDINIIFRYYTGSNRAPVPHQMIIPFHTTLDDVITLNYTVDCSTF